MERKVLSVIAIFLLTIQYTYAQSIELWGMTSQGGSYNYGVIFEYHLTTNSYTKKIDFDSINGMNPHGSLMQANNGNLYGMTSQGGLYNYGVLFEYDPITNSYTKKIDFDSINGMNPNGSLIQANNGKLYGMTSQGGLYNYGVLFEYNPTTNSYTKKIDFDSINGMNPNGSLIQANNGKLYGMTSQGGINNNKGVIFEYNITSNNLSSLYDFDVYGNTGEHPYGSLIQATNKRFYGMTSSGGSNGNGVVFNYDTITNIYAVQYNLGMLTNGGRAPIGSLLQANNGKMYGITYMGGTNYYGVIFEYNPTPPLISMSNKYNFNGTDGSYPEGSLMQSVNGNLYGMTSQGGTNYYGVIFEYNTSTNAYTKKYDFTGIDGNNPNGNLIEMETVGIKETTNANMTIFPNPTDKCFTIRLDKSSVRTQLNIFSIEGKLVYHKYFIKQDKIIINSSLWSKGVYFIKIQNNQYNKVSRLIKQ